MERCNAIITAVATIVAQTNSSEAKKLFFQAAAAASLGDTDNAEAKFNKACIVESDTI